MSGYEYSDTDIETVVNNASVGDENSCEIQFKNPVEVVTICKADVVHLAKTFGLVLYEKDTEL